MPKVLVPVAGRPMIEHVLEAVKEAGVDEKPIVVVGHRMDQVCTQVGARCEYVIQTVQLGTGHALQAAMQHLGSARYVLVLYGDHPFLSSRTIRHLAEAASGTDAPVTLMTIRLPDFEEERRPFFDFGRIVRGADGRVERIVETRDASEEERRILEVNPGYYCFDAAWLREHIVRLGNANTQGEFYLTDLIGIAMQQGSPIHTVTVTNALEGMGVNTPEQLALAEVVFEKRSTE